MESWSSVDRVSIIKEQLLRSESARVPAGSSPHFPPSPSPPCACTPKNRARSSARGSATAAAAEKRGDRHHRTPSIFNVDITGYDRNHIPGQRCVSEQAQHGGYGF